LSSLRFVLAVWPDKPDQVRRRIVAMIKAASF
jgi:hypothetical protein